MFWLFYIIFSLFFSCLVAFYFKNSNLLLFFLCLVILLTPAQIGIGSQDYAPAFFAFLFNAFLEQDYSLRVLRPLALTIPSAFIILFLVSSIKRRFS